MKIKGKELPPLLASLVSVCLATLPYGSACPRRCACYVPTEVHCTFRYLTAIPDTIPANAERINLGYNSLIKLTETDFTGLHKLELLMLHSNEIHDIPDKTFTDLHALQVLKMSYNKVRRLHKDTFHGLRSLTRLHLDHNHLEFINPETFYGLTSLRLVHLEGNLLTKLHPNTFVSLSYFQIFKISFIKYIYLSDNFLTSIPQEMILYMTELESIYLHGNPWVCDCELNWLPDWIQQNPGTVKCKRDRSSSTLLQCPLCTNPKKSKGKRLAEISAEALACVKPTIDFALKMKNLTLPEEGDSISLLSNDFVAPLGLITMNLTDQSGNEANLACNIQKPSKTLPVSFAKGSGYVTLNTSFSTFLVCNIDHHHIQPLWRILAMYSDSPLRLERTLSFTQTPQLTQTYRQITARNEDIFTDIKAELRADPSWLMQDQISLQLDRTVTTLSTLHVRYLVDAHVTVPHEKEGKIKLKWAMISRDNTTKLERTVLVGGTMELDCPAQGDPSPHLEWVLADGSKVRAPYISEDGRILVNKAGKLELQTADGFDTGLYHCISTNYDDADILTYRVTVVDPNVGSHHVNGASHVSSFGETLDLPCRSTGIPDASVSWVLPGNIVLHHSTGNKQILSDGTLRILKVTEGDSGYFRCVAANPYGVDFLIFLVSVDVKGNNLEYEDGEADGSGKEELKATPTNLREASVVQNTVPPEADMAKQDILNPSKRQNYSELMYRRHGDPINRRFREHRRQFPPSARRLDPRQWAAFLEKAKKPATPEKVGSAITTLPTRVTALSKFPGDGEESSGVLPPDEEFMLLTTRALETSASPVTTDSITPPGSSETSITPGKEALPIVSPQTSQPERPEKLMSNTNVNPSTSVSTHFILSTSSNMQGVTTQQLPTTSSLMSVPIKSLRNEQPLWERNERSKSMPTTLGDDITRDSNVNISGNPRGKDHVFRDSVDQIFHHHLSLITENEPNNDHFYSHATQKTLTSKFPIDSTMMMQNQVWAISDVTTTTPLIRHYGRRRKIWGRRRIISPGRIPNMRGHRYPFLRPRFKVLPEERTPLLPKELDMECPTCTLGMMLTTAPSHLLLPSAEHATLPKMESAKVASVPTTPYPNSASELEEVDKPYVELEKTTPIMRYFSAESTHVMPKNELVALATMPLDTEKSFSMNISHLFSTILSTTVTKKGTSNPTPHSSVISMSSTPSMRTFTRAFRRKIPWHQIFVNNYVQREMPKNLNQSSLQTNIVTVPPKMSPVIPTDGNSFHFTTLSSKEIQIPAITQKFTPKDSIPEGASPENVLTMTDVPTLLFYPNTASIKSLPNTDGFTSIRSPPPIYPSDTVIRSQTARPGRWKGQRQRQPQKNIMTAQGITEFENSVTTSSGTTAPPNVMIVQPLVSPSIFTMTPSPSEGTKGIPTSNSLNPLTFNATDINEEVAKIGTQTLAKTADTNMTLPSKVLQNTLASKTPFLRISNSTEVPKATSIPFSRSEVTDQVPITLFGMMAHNEPKPQETPSLHIDQNMSGSETEAPSGSYPQTESSFRTTPFIYADLYSMPVLPLTTVEPQSSKDKITPLWAENLFWHQSYPEIADRGKIPVANMLTTVKFPESITQRTPKWGGQKENVIKSSLDQTAVQETTTARPLIFASLSRNRFEKPRIVGGKAASFTVLANSDAFIPCEATGNPSPTIHWTRVSPGIVLSEEMRESRFEVFSNGTLFIQNVKIQDRGQYLCVVANQHGSDRLYVTLSVIAYPPRILEGRTKEITAHSGSSVEVKCRAEGRPTPEISWILANQTVVSESSQGNNQAVVKSDGTLVINTLTVYDRGVYTCMANNPAGMDSWLVKIQVVAAPPIILEQKRQFITGIWGENLKLPCTAKGNPQPSVHWVLSDGTEVKPLQFINAKWFLFPNGTLYIRNIASSDRGNYECIATSSTGSERRVVNLMVEERDTIPRIETASKKLTEVNFGDKLLLNCSATGEPKPRIIWRLPSKAIVDQWHRMGSRIHVYPNGSLLIGAVTEKDAGDYLCVARNKIGDDLILMKVSLRMKPAKIDHKQQFKKHVLHGKDFQVDCKASGSPVPEISWSLPDGTMINNVMQADDSRRRTRRYILFDNGTLYFNKVGIAEEGDYTCYAQNTLGKDEMKVHLTVVTAAPRIRQSHKTYIRVTAGETAVLVCEVIGEPKPQIFWLIPSSDIISSSTDRYLLYDNGSLSIGKVKLLDSGEYMCVARNPSGDDTRLYRLDVVSKLPLINGLYSNKTVIKTTAVQHSKKHLDCRAEGTPPPEIMWIMPDNIFLTAPYHGSRITVHKNGTLEIRNVRLTDTADFICIARNDGGESVLVVQLKVLEMLRRPTFRNPFNEKVVVQPGKPMALNCSVDGNPPPEIIWLLPNGTRFSSGSSNSWYQLGRNGSLIIIKPTRDDAGKYRCAARNKVGYIEKLIILEIGQKPVILTYVRGMIKSITGESVSLHCMSDGSPKPNIIWTVPSGHVIDRPQINGKYTLHENGTLVISKATPHDRGSYACKAQNSMGEAVITIPVMIVAYPPRIINRPPRNVRTLTGEAIQLHCVALGIPKPEVTWEMPDHSVLSAASNVRASRSELLHPQGTLILQNLKTSDAGTYTCIAKNQLGSDYATTYVQVI
ncbi:immunoglobulin superfamily member 10 [Phascolarctos cinereus]|uniref:immunoglobulin superfamily member 10 n=1 Tax=Phascolarctos cinereus TaxID=38626 RepID=UPI000A28AD53|nr:immunoglobulin superfamily member 10 [Phascolarctos cinereus]